MAIFKSGLVSDIRGSVNGLTFSRTKAGNIIRNRTQPVQPNSAAQVEQRGLMQIATDMFKELTPAEVDDWALAISGTGFTETNAIGDTYTPSAKQVFTQLALNNFQLGLGSAPPDLGKFLADPNRPGIAPSLSGSLNISVAAGPPVELTVLELVLELGPNASNVQVAATMPLLPSVRNYTKYLRVVDTYAASTNINIVTNGITKLRNYNDLYPGIDWTDVVGNRIGIAARAINDATGLASAWLNIGLVEVPVAA